MSIWLIAGLLVWFTIIMAFIGDEKFLPSFWILVIPGVIMSYFGWEHIVSWFGGLSLTTMVMAPIVYLAAGFVVAVIKWAFRSSKAATYVATSKNFVLHERASQVRYQFEGLALIESDGVESLTRSNKFNAVIGAWVVWWPFVLIASLFTDFIGNIVRIVTGWMGGTFQAITDYFFNQANKGK